MGTILEEIEKIVSKRPNCRTDEEVARLLPWFKKKSDVFRTLKPDAVADIIRNCEIIKRPKDSVVIRQNDKGNCFFIILGGRVSVYITTREDDDEVEEETERVTESAQALGLPANQHSTVNNDVGVDKEPTITQETSTKQTLPELVTPKTELKRTSVSSVVEAFHLPSIAGGHNIDRSKYGQYVAGIGDGKSFGELALLKKNCIRNATIITDTATQLLVVNRELYNRCIRESQEKEFTAKQMFVHTSEYFDGWNLRSKRQMAMSLHLRTYTYGTPIVCQGQPLDFIYFLQSGQCRVVIDPCMHRSQYPNYSIEIQKRSANPSISSLQSDYKPPQILRRGRTRGYAVRGYDLCLIGEFNMIGDIELSTNLPTYMQSVTCEQYTEAFAIDLRNYDRLVTRRHAFTGRVIAQNALLKLDNRALRFPHISLLRIVTDRFSHLRREFQRSKKQKEEKQSKKSKTLAQTVANNRRRTTRSHDRLVEATSRTLQDYTNVYKYGLRLY